MGLIPNVAEILSVTFILKNNILCANIKPYSIMETGKTTVDGLGHPGEGLTSESFTQLAHLLQEDKEILDI